MSELALWLGLFSLHWVAPEHFSRQLKATKMLMLKKKTQLFFWGHFKIKLRYLKYLLYLTKNLNELRDEKKRSKKRAHLRKT